MYRVTVCFWHLSSVRKCFRYVSAGGISLPKHITEQSAHDDSYIHAYGIGMEIASTRN